MLRRACVLGLALPAAAQNFAIAQIKGAQNADNTGAIISYNPISGHVKFEQAADNPLGDVTVTYEIDGLPGGTYGFHVHQYGDTRITYDLASMAAHFVPTCVPPDIGEDGNAPAVTEAACGAAATRSCECDQVRSPPHAAPLDGPTELTSGCAVCDSATAFHPAPSGSPETWATSSRPAA